MDEILCVIGYCCATTSDIRILAEVYRMILNMLFLKHTNLHICWCIGRQTMGFWHHHYNVNTHNEFWLFSTEICNGIWEFLFFFLGWDLFEMQTTRKRLNHKTERMTQTDAYRLIIIITHISANHQSISLVYGLNFLVTWTTKLFVCKCIRHLSRQIRIHYDIFIWFKFGHNNRQLIYWWWTSVAIKNK